MDFKTRAWQYLTNLELWMKRVWHYSSNLEWTERVQHDCKFCDHSNFKNIVYQNNEVIAIETIRPAGQFHWLILPKEHAVRDIENLGGEHVELLKNMDDAKQHLLRSHCPDSPTSAIHSGYHRGRRPLLRKLYWPDIISIHHLHLHVIVNPSSLVLLLKYPAWLPLMWKSDEKVMQEVQKQNKRTI